MEYQCRSGNDAEPPKPDKCIKRVVAIARKDAKYEKRAKNRGNIVADDKDKANKKHKEHHARHLHGGNTRSAVALGGGMPSETEPATNTAVPIITSSIKNLLLSKKRRIPDTAESNDIAPTFQNKDFMCSGIADVCAKSAAV